jgi:hypothetical protein
MLIDAVQYMRPDGHKKYGQIEISDEFQKVYNNG